MVRLPQHIPSASSSGPRSASSARARSVSTHGALLAPVENESRPMRWKIATHVEELDAVQGLRFRSFREELGIPIASPVGRDISPYDCLSSSVHVVVLRDSNIVGTARMCLPNAEVAEFSRTHFGLQCEETFDLGSLLDIGAQLAEIGRVCVLGDYRRSTDAVERLYEALFVLSRQYGVRYWIGAVDCQTSRSDDAATMYAVMQHRGLVLGAPRVRTSKQPPSALQARELARNSTGFYSDEERARAGRDELARLRVAAPLAAFSKRLGARCIGAPAVHPAYPRWVIPMLVDVERLPADTLSKFDPTQLAPAMPHGFAPRKTARIP